VHNFERNFSFFSFSEKQFELVSAENQEQTYALLAFIEEELILPEQERQIDWFLNKDKALYVFLFSKMA
jgi:hypothetical protein